MLASITPVILTLDEEPNIDRTLSALSWAGDIVIVDSGSTDRTLEIARAYPQVRIFTRPFDQHASQWSFAISQTGIASEWILALDADYQVSDALTEELRRLEPPAGIAGYRTSFEYCIFGKPLRGSVYPPVTTVYRRDRGRSEHQLAPRPGHREILGGGVGFHAFGLDQIFIGHAKPGFSCERAESVKRTIGSMRARYAPAP